MAYVKNKNGFEIGEWAITTRKLDSCAGYFEKGTKVKVIGKSYRGYDLEDESKPVTIVLNKRFIFLTLL